MAPGGLSVEGKCSVLGVYSYSYSCNTFTVGYAAINIHWCKFTELERDIVATNIALWQTFLSKAPMPDRQKTRET